MVSSSHIGDEELEVMNLSRDRRLRSAVSGADEAEVRSVLVACGPWTSQRDRDTLHQFLLKAATSGNLSLTQILLDHGVYVHPRRYNDVFPLYKASEAGHLAVVTELLKHNGNTDWRTKNGQTALFPACVRGHYAVVKALLDEGADPDGGRHGDGIRGDSDGRTPLLILASEKPTQDTCKIAELLIDNGADINARDSTGRVPLHWVAKTGHLDLARILLSGKDKALVNAAQNRGITALHYAAESDHVKSVKLLLSHGANVDAVSDAGWTPLHSACQKGCSEVVSALLAAGANVNAELSNRMTPLHCATLRSGISAFFCYSVPEHHSFVLRCRL